MAATSESSMSPLALRQAGHVMKTASEADAQPTSSPLAQAPTTKALPIRDTSVKLSVPIDSANAGTDKSRNIATVTAPASYQPKQTLRRRDSLERREALLKGKEGSRQRRRWENDRLMNNPWAEPPLPSDWEVRPVYPRRTVPYYLAPLWDAAEFQRAVEAKLHGRRGSKNVRKGLSGGMSPMEEAATAIPKEVRRRLKYHKSARGLLMDLEEDVRGFVRLWNEKETRLRDGQEGGNETENGEVLVESDEEIVFVGRKRLETDGLKEREKSSRERPIADWDERPSISREKMVFEGLDGDKGASFARWLVHCVGGYYGLRTWSVTREVQGSEEKRREAYVGIDSRARGFMGRGKEIGQEIELPRPLWGMV